MSVISHNVEQGTPEWHAIREGKYTGSNAHKLLRFGKIPYSQNSDSTSWAGNFYTRRGHTLEDRAIKLYERIYGVKVDRPGFVTNTKYPQCGYSPDGIANGKVIEVKAFQGDRHKAVKEYQEYEIVAQIEYGKFICELKEGVLLLYNPDIDVESALIIIEMPYRRLVRNNFKRVLGG